MKQSGSSDVPNLNSNVYLKYIFFLEHCDNKFAELQYREETAT